MTTTLHPYPKYKPSNIDWLDGVPDGWNVRKMKFLFSLLKRPVRDEDKIITAFRDGKVTLRRNRREDGFTIALQESGYQGVRKGDLVIHGMDGFAGAIGISDSDGKATPVYSVCSPKEQDIVPHYYAYLLRTLALTGYIVSLARGIRERSTEFKWNIVGNLLLILPPLETQKRIADFLDEKTEIIDELIEKKEKLIELLREKRASLITHAVTKGLDPNAKLKPSGIDWLGDIPNDWEAYKVKYLISRNDGGVWGDADDPDGTPVLRSTEVSIDGRWRINEFELAYRALSADEINKGKLIEGDLVVTKSSGSEEHIGKTALVDKNIAEKAYCYSNFMQRLRPKRITSPRLLYYFLNSQSAREQYKYVSNSTTGLGNLNASMLNSLYFLLIPKRTQDQIADFLNTETAKIDKAVSLIELQNEKLKEYRSSLIYHVVTGKIQI